MNPISSLAYVESCWVQPKAMKKRFELRAGEDLFASLEFPSAFRSRAFAQAADGQWTFEPRGFWQNAIQVWENGQQPGGVFQLRWTGTTGSIELADGRTFRWRVANFWATRFTWEAEEGQPLITYQSGTGSMDLGEIFKVQARMQVAPEAQSERFLSLLGTLGWYLIIRHHDQSAAAAA